MYSSIHNTEMNQLHPSFSISGCYKDPHVCISAFKTWLLQFSTVWHSTVPIQLLQKVQNTAARITLKAPRAGHTSPLLLSLHCLPIQKRIKHKVCSIYYATLTGTSPKYMSEFVNVYIPSRCLCSLSNSRTITIPCIKPRPVCNLCLSRTSYMEWPTICVCMVFVQCVSLLCCYTC